MADRLDDIERSLRDDVVTIRPKPSAPPPSGPPGRHWTPAGVVLVITAFGGLMGTMGVVLGPLLVKPDYAGWVKEERLEACKTRLDERTKAQDAALDAERERTSVCYSKLGDCRSQQGANEQVIESLGAKRKR